MDWEDILQTPYRRGGRAASGLDCAGVAEEINVRLNHIERGDLIFPRADTPAVAFEEFMRSSVENFDDLGSSTFAAQQLGDFVVTDPKGDGLGAHIFTLVGLHPRVFLTALQGRGIRPVAERAIKNVMSVHRVRRAR